MLIDDAVRSNPADKTLQNLLCRNREVDKEGCYVLD